MTFNWKKAIILLCMFMFLADLAEDGRIGPAKSRIGWGHGFSTYTESFSHDIRPLPQKTKTVCTFSVDNPLSLPLSIILETSDLLDFTENSLLKGHGSGGVPL